MRYLLILIILWLCMVNCTAQNRNNIWCFGDSAGIDFNGTVPVPIKTDLKSRGSSVSISDSIGQLLFYAHTKAGVIGNTTLVYNRINKLMQNGTNIIGEGWYLELCIIPDPSDSNKYYLFSIGVTGSSQTGLYYSTIDMTQDSGRGAVVLKNVQLQTAKSSDCITAIKHGNGRDWWVFYRRWDNANNDFYTYLVSPAGVTLQAVQSVGTPSSNGFLTLTFSANGSKLAVKTVTGLLELYDFDRCSGIISNPVTLETETSPFPAYFDCEFSPDGNLLYVSSEEDTSYLFQYNLNAANPAQTRDTLFTITYPTYSGGFLKLAPDGKIYWSCAWNAGVFPFPYPDTIFNMYVSNLSVINQPDSLGAACNFTLYSFYLGGGRTYWGLPNNPDYDMPRLQGSPCDTVQWTGSPPAPKGGEKAVLHTTYVSDWQKLFVNAQGLKGVNGLLQVYDITGKKVFELPKQTVRGGYYTFDLDCNTFATGMYIIKLQTEKEMLATKFIKN